VKVERIICETYDSTEFLVRALQIVAEAGVDVRAFSAEGGRLAIITAQADAARVALGQHGIRCTSEAVHAVRIEDRPGELARLLQGLAEAGVRVHGGVGAASGGGGHVYIAMDDVAAAAPVVRARANAQIEHPGLRRIGYAVA
jgi:hypothetical protein